MLSKWLIQIFFWWAILFPDWVICHVPMFVSIDQMIATPSDSWQISRYRWQKAIKNISKVNRPSGRFTTWKSCWWGNGRDVKRVFIQLPRISYVKEYVVGCRTRNQVHFGPKLRDLSPDANFQLVLNISPAPIVTPFSPRRNADWQQSFSLFKTH